MTFPTEAEARDFQARMGMSRQGVAIIPTTHGYWTITSEKMASQPAKTCLICREPYREFPNNARPVNDGQCCAYCDDHVVTPTRIASVKGQ